MIKTNSSTLIAYCKVPSVAASWMAQLQIMFLHWVIFMEYLSDVKLWCSNSSFFYSAEDHHIKACRITAIASTWTWQLQIGGVQCSRSLYQSLQDYCNCTAKGNLLCLLVDCTWGSSKAWQELGCKMSQMANLTYNERKPWSERKKP